MIRQGTVLIAKRTVHMAYNPKDICLTKGRKYIVDRIEDSCIVFNSNIIRGHYWALDEIADFFIFDLKLNKKTKTL